MTTVVFKVSYSGPNLSLDIGIQEKNTNNKSGCRFYFEEIIQSTWLKTSLPASILYKEKPAWHNDNTQTHISTLKHIVNRTILNSNIYQIPKSYWLWTWGRLIQPPCAHTRTRTHTRAHTHRSLRQIFIFVGHQTGGVWASVQNASHLPAVIVSFMCHSSVMLLIYAYWQRSVTAKVFVVKKNDTKCWIP